MTKPQAQPLDEIVHQYRLATRFLALMLVGVVGFGLLGYFSLRANDDAIVAARTEARYTECVRDNRRSDQAVANARSEAQVLIAAAKATGGAKDDTVNDSYVAAQEAAARKLYPTRLCTPEAIADYYERQAAAR